MSQRSGLSFHFDIVIETVRQGAGHTASRYLAQMPAPLGFGKGREAGSDSPQQIGLDRRVPEKVCEAAVDSIDIVAFNMMGDIIVAA